MVKYANLPFDVIAEISLAAWGMDSKLLREMSLLDKRTRAACIPLLFRNVVFDLQYGDGEIPWGEFNEGVENLLAQGLILRAIKYCRIGLNLSWSDNCLEAFISNRG